MHNRGSKNICGEDKRLACVMIVHLSNIIVKTNFYDVFYKYVGGLIKSLGHIIVKSELAEDAKRLRRGGEKDE